MRIPFLYSVLIFVILKGDAKKRCGESHSLFASAVAFFCEWRHGCTCWVCEYVSHHGFCELIRLCTGFLSLLSSYWCWALLMALFEKQHRPIVSRCQIKVVVSVLHSLADWDTIACRSMPPSPSKNVRDECASGSEEFAFFPARWWNSCHCWWRKKW